jgi:tellurite resistance protein TerC
VSTAGALEWTVFAAAVATLLAVDLVVSRGRPGRQDARSAWIRSGVFIAAGLAFGGFVALRLGTDAATTYVTAYLLEEALSVDNLAIFALVFAQTGVPPAFQRRALFWGAFSAIAIRAVMIGGAVALFQRFHWIVYPFGLLLLYSAVRMLRGEERRYPWLETTCSLCTSWVARCFPITPTFDSDRFIVKLDGRRYATPLLVALVAIEATDVVFSVDSIPAVFSVTRDPFVVYTSNIFALLGLRSLYALVGDAVQRYAWLRIALAVLLVLVAVKLMLSDLLHIPPGLSLAVIGVVLGAGVLASRLLPNPERGAPRPSPCPHVGDISVHGTDVRVCPQCVALGDTWVQLRMCMSCGQVGCCDSSKNRHATAHFTASRHPIIRSIEPGEDWKWCYVDERVIDEPSAAR